MDSVTHIVLGACIGEALLGQRIGKKALVIGAVAQSIPDFDFITSFWLDPAEQLLAHRGITHSLLFVLLVSPIIGFIAHKLSKKQISILGWSNFFMLQMLVHLFLDAFNNYGVGWLEPFNSVRISFNTIYVADPLMTIFPLIATIVLTVISSGSPRRQKWWKIGIIVPYVYLCICIFNKIYITSQAKKAFAQEHIVHDRYFTTPAPFQTFLWMVVAGDDNGFNVGYRSLFDTKPGISFRYFPKNESMLDTISHHNDVLRLKTFSQGFYTVEKWSDTLVFNDLRFGQIIGWNDPKEKFVFHYFLQHPASNRLVIQRGRLLKWSRKELLSFLRRIAGN